MSDLVTGEAVVVELRVARLATRSLALAVDAAGQLTVLVAGALLVTGLATDPALEAALALSLTVAVLVGYPVVAETLSRGRTLGKLALGLRVVRDDGGPVRLRHALVRALTGVVEIWLFSGTVALMVSLASRNGKRVGDYLAGTLVVRERAPGQSGPLWPMPAPLAGWAAGLELSRLPDDLALAARQYLGRWHELSPGARQDMGARLATAVSGHVSPAPPVGVPAEAYLAAVLAERRRRQAMRTTPYAGSAPYSQPPVTPRPQPPPGPAGPFAPPS